MELHHNDVDEPVSNFNTSKEIGLNDDMTPDINDDTDTNTTPGTDTATDGHDDEFPIITGTMVENNMVSMDQYETDNLNIDSMSFQIGKRTSLKLLR